MKTVYFDSVGRNLRRLLTAKGMTAAELAKASGVTKQRISTLTQLKTSDGRTFATLKKLARALGVPVTEVIKK